MPRARASGLTVAGARVTLVTTMRAFVLGVGVVMAALAANGVTASAAAPTGKLVRAVRTDGQLPSIEFEKYTLPNGLQVILAQDRRLPLVAFNLRFHVGAKDETPGL